MHRTTVMLPEGLKHRASERARQMHMSLGEFLRMAAESYLEREERAGLSDPLLGSDYTISEPSPAHVSENVDRYLYGARE
ncbi:MAG: ribbon-helix-helix protein, CopG family [Chitinivibrionales bacterium]|nr:ribbon-helix-helix protein, CopG family [Chitinivibrionales bacterium]